MSEQKIFTAHGRARQQLNTAEGTNRTGMGRGSHNGDTDETNHSGTYGAANHAYEQATDAPTSDFPLQVFSSRAHIFVLSRNIVEFLGMSNIFQLGQHFGVKVVKCVSPMPLFASTGETQNAAIGSLENIQQLEQHIIREVHTQASSLGGECSSQHYGESAMPESAQQFSHGRHRHDHESQPPTHQHGNPTHHRVVIREPLSRSQPLQVNEITMRYVNEFLSNDTASIQESCQVGLQWSPPSDDGTVILTIVGLKAESDVTTARDKLAQICIGVSSTLGEERLPISKDTYEIVRAKVDLEVCRALTSYENTDDGPMCVIMGPKENVRLTKQKFQKVIKSLPPTSGNCFATLVLKNRLISVKKGDLTQEPVNAVVNAANELLKHSGGLAQAIVDAGGEKIQVESNELIRTKGRLKAGDAVYTNGGRLPCKYVIHSVAPVWDPKNPSTTLQKLQLACSNALRIATDLNLKSIAIPGLGSGSFGIPKDHCATTLFSAVEDFFRKVPNSSLTHVVFISIDGETTRAFEKECKIRDTTTSKHTHKGKSPSNNEATPDCSICCYTPTTDNPMVALPCDKEHRLCVSCHNKLSPPVCPFCQKPFGTVRGNQPRGSTMNYRILDSSLPGYESHKTIQIIYDIPEGVQTDEHPTPGKKYSGTTRTAFIPDIKEGREVYRLLKKAFERRLIFTIGRSVTSGHDGVITWNDIHHKTRQTGGPDSYGYPDPGYLGRVKSELHSKGVNE